jgi:hypothetical protein
MWTMFMDMHSGGGQKTKYEYVYIKGTEEEAKRTFEKVLGRDPDHASCPCCGSDFGAIEYTSLTTAAKDNKLPRETVQEHLHRKDVLVIN